MVKIPTAASGNIVPSSGWNIVRDVAESSGWIVSSGLSLNTIFQNGDSKALLVGSIRIETDLLNTSGDVEFLVDAGSPPTAKISQASLVVTATGAFHLPFSVPVPPSHYFKINVFNSGSGVILTAARLYNW